MTEICKICGRDAELDLSYQEITETEGAKPYILCDKCYPMRCPKCRMEMEEIDPGCDFDEEGKSEHLWCEKCRIQFGVWIIPTVWSRWYERYCRDMGMPVDYRKYEEWKLKEECEEAHIHPEDS